MELRKEFVKNLLDSLQNMFNQSETKGEEELMIEIFEYINTNTNIFDGIKGE